MPLFILSHTLWWDTMVYLILQQPELQHWLSSIETDVPDIENISPPLV